MVVALLLRPRCAGMVGAKSIAFFAESRFFAGEQGSNLQDGQREGALVSPQVNLVPLVGEEGGFVGLEELESVESEEGKTG